MSDNEKKCPRCRGQKSIYKIGKSGYTLENFGGEKVDCPSCSGVGYIAIPDFVEEAKKEQEALNEVKVIKRKRRTKEELEKDARASESAQEEAPI